MLYHWTMFPRWCILLQPSDDIVVRTNAPKIAKSIAAGGVFYSYIRLEVSGLRRGSRSLVLRGVSFV